MTTVVNLIATVAPFLALVPTAWLVYARTMQHLAWPWPIAVVAALAVELLGLAIAVTLLDNWTWNRSKRKTDDAAPIVLPVALLAVYFASALALVVLADIVPGMVRYLPGLFPVLGLAGMVTIAVRRDQAERAAETARMRADAKAERAAKRAEQKEAKPEPVKAEPQAPLLAFACKHPGCQSAFASQAALNGHGKAHGNGHERKEIEHVGLGSKKVESRTLGSRPLGSRPLGR